MNIDNNLLAKINLHQNQEEKLKQSLKSSGLNFQNELNNKLQEKTSKPKTINPDKKQKYLKKLKETTEQFEALFINMMFKEMRKSVDKYKLIDGGMAENIFKDMLYHEYSQSMAKNEKFGIAELLYDQLSPQITGRFVKKK